jgi:hypothetical protein
MGLECLRRLVLARRPELTLDDLKAAFGGDAWSNFNASVLAEIADAVTDAIEALEARLGGVEQSLPRRWQ